MIAPAVVAPPSSYPLAVMAALTLAVSILARPSGRVTLDRAAGGVAVLSLAADIGYFGPPGLVILWYPFETAALIVLLARAVRHVPVPRVGVIGPLTGAAATLLPLRFTLHAPDTGLQESVFVCSLALIPAGCAVGVGLYLRSLDNRRAHAVALARREQRLEVARDLHDFVAHEVTGIVLEAQAAQLSEDTGSAGGEEHRALLQRIEKAGLRALDSMDQTVTALREAEGRRWDEPPPTRLYGLADLPELVDRFSSMGAAEVALSLEAETAGILSREAEDTAYRVVLESLTNIRRHAPRADRVQVLAGRTADRSVEVSVADHSDHSDHSSRQTPAAPRPPVGTGRRSHGGTGLAGLTERVSALGGTLEAGPSQHGWRVRCLLPVPAIR
ncbi:hypothetical protein GCM10010387_19920 [Streptomyces inusitatus]|uniref:histidine kinase n=2 Tax=Streptomyces inusitatus TaxID=68221 RepID=A0A918PXW1_9ACTN|nr:hypothetical protein GCM10010387_19920 [Streptomyces inusitatus]